MKKLGVHRIFLHGTGIIAPRAEDHLDFLRFFRGRADSGRNALTNDGFVLRCSDIHHFCNGLGLLRFALGLICRVDHCLLQRGILHGISHLLQTLCKFLLRLIPRRLQLFKRFQRTVFAAELRQQFIQLCADLCRKLGRGLIGGQLPALADRLDRGIVRILGHMVEQLRVEFLCLCCKSVRVGSLRKQRIERLENVSGQCGEAVQLRCGLLLDGFHALIVFAQITINAILQLGALQNTIRFLCRRCPGILKIAPTGIHDILYRAKVFLHFAPP